MDNAQTVRVAIHGAAGRIGREVVRAVSESTDLALVALIDRIPFQELDTTLGDVPYYTDPVEAFKESHPHVVVDFSLTDASLSMIELALTKDVSPIIGTTGFTEEQIALIESLCNRHNVPAIYAPNFSIGAILLSKLSVIASQFFETVDITEEHHEGKLDSPSGTALGIAKSISDRRSGPFNHTKSDKEPLPGTRGGLYEGIAIHSSRMPGVMANHQVTFGGSGQTLSIRHNTINRSCYTPGVLLAIRKVRSLTGLTIGLDSILELDVL